MTIVHLAILWCLGIVAADAVGTDVTPVWTAGCIAAAIVALLLRDRQRARVAILYLLVFFAGGLRADVTFTKLNVKQIDNFGNDAEVTLIGVVSEPPRLRDDRVDVVLSLEAVHGLDGDTGRVQGRFLVEAPRFPALRYGDRIRATGVLEPFQDYDDFDYEAYMARRGMFRKLPNARVVRLEPNAGNHFYQTVYALRENAQNVIETTVPEPQSSLLTGILLGDDSGMPQPLVADFRTTGMTHVIAISGFNIAILAGAILRGTRRLLGMRNSAWAALAGIAIYTVLVGADAAVVRAAIMGSLYIFSSRLLGRPTFAPAGLFVAAWLMTLANPTVLWDAGFQLSFTATLGLMLFVEPLSRRLQGWLERYVPADRLLRLMPLLTDVIIVTFAAQLMSLPLIAYHFGQISIASVLANLLILPAQSGVMLWGGAATIAGLISPLLGQPLAWVAWLFLAYTTTLVEALAQLPFAVVDVKTRFWTVVLFYTLLLAAYWLLRQSQERRDALLEQARGRAAHGTPVLLFLSLALTISWQRTQPDDNLHVAFLDVGQGDAIFIQTPSGRQMLVDGGPRPSLLNAQLGRQMPFWDHHLDVVVATHPDDDHVLGLPEVFDRYRVDLLLTNGAQEGASNAFDALLQEAREDGARLQVAAVGQRVVIDDGVQLTILHPGATPLETDNDNSVSVHLTYGDFSLLLTGDAELEAEEAMVATGLPLRALVFKAGHHGSRTSSNVFFLEAVRPQIILISSGADNRFGHPHEAVLERAADIAATVLRTDELGTIEVVTDGKRMWWEAARRD